MADVLVCVICGEPWAEYSNTCECGGFCTWGKEKGGCPSSWHRDKQGNYVPNPPPKEK